MRRALMVVAVLIATATPVGLFAAPADALGATLLWGPRFGHSRLVLDQDRLRNYYQDPHAPVKFSIQRDGNLVLYKHFNDDRSWLPYWTSYTAGKGDHLVLERDGELSERNSHGKEVWSNNRHPGRNHTYNYALYLSSSGRLLEYYSSGDPRKKAGRHVTWSVNRPVNTVSKCISGPVNAASDSNPTSVTSVPVLVGGSNPMRVFIDNHSYTFGETITVSRWNGNHNGATYSHVLHPRKTYTFTGGFYQDDNLPETVTLHLSTTSYNPSVGFEVFGHCWYNH